MQVPAGRLNGAGKLQASPAMSGEVIVTFIRSTVLGLQTSTLKVTAQAAPQPGSVTWALLGLPSRSHGAVRVTLQVMAAASTLATALSCAETIAPLFAAVPATVTV